MKKLFATVALGAILFSIAPVAFAGGQEGQVFEPRTAPTYLAQPAQGAQIFSPNHEPQEPLNNDIRN